MIPLMPENQSGSLEESRSPRERPDKIAAALKTTDQKITAGISIFPIAAPIPAATLSNESDIASAKASFGERLLD